jgi:hypothetical protein
MEKVIIKLKNKEDFRQRIARLWQNQKENQIYEFIFPDKETEEEFENLFKAFK